MSSNFSGSSDRNILVKCRSTRCFTNQNVTIFMIHKSLMISGIFFLLNVFPVHTMKAYGESRSITPLILDFGTRRRWLVNLMPQPHYLWKEPQYPLNSKLGGPQNWSGSFGEETHILPLLGFKLDVSACSLVATPIPSENSL